MNTYSINEYVDMIEKRLDTLLTYGDIEYKSVCDAMRYSIKNGGKRIRPILVLEFCRICGGNVEDALDFACALEMIHTYSLIHDDLPCMDNDNMRRGKPSCHIAFGEDTALLAGDGLLTHAFTVASSSKFASKSPERAIRCVQYLSLYSGYRGMIGGQVIDLSSEGKKISLETLQKMDEYKTGALIKSAALMGVTIGCGNKEEEIAAEKYATALGQAFQIVDDILDVTADEAVLGKPVGSDADSNKSTYVSILGLEKSKELAKELTDEAISALDVFSGDCSFLKKLALDLQKRNN